MKNIIHILFLIPITLFAQEWHEEDNIYEYDNLNRLVKVVFHNGIVYEYQYDNLGNRLGKTIDVELPADNYDISTVGLTCINSSDGIIHIEVDRKNTYNVEIDSPENSFNETHTLNNANEWELNIDYLEGGEHFIYITIYGIPEDIYKKTFILYLDEPEPLEVASRVANNQAGRFTVEMIKGTAPFTITLNDEVIATTSNSEFTFDAQHGDVVQVTTSKACEGIYRETLSVLDAIALHPNPTDDKVFFNIPAMENTALSIQLFDINGRLVGSFTSNLNSSQIEISIQHLPNGVYLATFPDLGEKTFKIIKE